MNPFNDNDNDNIPPPPPINHQGEDNMISDEANNNYTPPQIQSTRPEDTATLQEWDRAAQRYQQETSMTTDETEETIDDDPLASPGNSSLNSGYGGGWSLAAGLVDEQGSICFVTEEDEEEEDEDQRSSSPRESHIKKHGLSMIKEENGTSNMSSKDNTTSTLFDDVDLEAFPGNLPTAAIQKNGSFSPNTMENSKSSDDGSAGWYKGNIVNRILQEVQTNRKIRLKVMVGISLILVSSCLVAIAMAGSKSKGKQYIPNTAGASDLSELLLGLKSEEVEEETTMMPSLTPTSTPSSSPVEKPKTKLPSKSPITNKPTYEPTQFPTYILTSQSPTYIPTSAWPTISPSSHPGTKLPSYSPSLLPVTPYPTMNCVDSYGEYMTYNDKSRTCEWLDNGYNGAQSERKDLNCLNSQLGYECPFTCRLYNGCSEYLLALPEETENTVSMSSTECEDKDGTFMSEGNVPRECSWFEEDPTTAPTKKNLNCGNPSVPPTELGLNCRASCAGYNNCRHDGEERISPHPLAGLDTSLIDYGEDNEADSPTPFPSSIEPTFVWERCRDKDGEYLTHLGTLRSCRWFNRDDVEEKKRLNCGITPIGKKCMATCSCDTQLMQRNSQLVPTMVPTSGEPTPHPATKGIYTNEGVLTLSTLADASTSQKYYDTNEGDSKRLNVANEDGLLKAKQSLLLFDLSYVAKTLPVVSLAKLRIYCVVGSESGAAGIVLKKMASTNFTEYDVSWSTMPGGDGQDEPVVAFVDTLESNQWYDIDVTAAVLDALKNQESYLGLRLTTDGSDSIDVYFGSKERLNEPPTLIVDSRTGDPTYQPTDYPTYFPSMAPVHHFDCMNRKGKFTTHEGEREPCSWLEVGNGALKKEMNCKDVTSEAAVFCQNSCSAHNGCDDLHCTDMSGKSALVLFYHVHAGVLYKGSTT
jgi:hypothetical protein